MCPDTRASAYVSVYDLVYSVCATLYTVYFRAVYINVIRQFLVNCPIYIYIWDGVQQNHPSGVLILSL